MFDEEVDTSRKEDARIHQKNVRRLDQISRTFFSFFFCRGEMLALFQYEEWRQFFDYDKLKNYLAVRWLKESWVQEECGGKKVNERKK